MSDAVLTVTSSVFVCTILTLFTGSIARSATRRYLVYSEANFEVFRPAGATRCTDGVKFGTDEGTKGRLLHAKFHPHRCNDNGIGPPINEIKR